MMFAILFLSLWLNAGCLTLMYINVKYDSTDGPEVDGGAFELLEMVLTFPAVMLTYLVVWMVK